MLTDKQFFRIKEKLQEMDHQKLLKIVKRFKQGQGIGFLPRMSSKLVECLTVLLEKYASSKKPDIKSRIKAILDELLQRDIISKEGYAKTEKFMDTL